MFWTPRALKILVSVVQFRPEPPFSYGYVHCLVYRRFQLAGADILGAGRVPPRAIKIL